MKNLFTAAICVATIALSGCADKSTNVQPTYVSPLLYKNLSCRQIETEARRVSVRVGQISGVQDKNASNDAVTTGVALVLFWPAAFFVKGNKANAAELARLKGEMEALEQSSNEKNCGIKFVKPEPQPTPQPEKTDQD